MLGWGMGRFVSKVVYRDRNVWDFVLMNWKREPDRNGNSRIKDTDKSGDYRISRNLLYVR